MTAGRRCGATVAEVEEALADALTRAIHRAPETLLAQLAGPGRAAACRRLALRVVHELAGDGWGEGRGRCGASRLAGAVAAGLRGAGAHLLSVLPEVRRCNGRLLDGVGGHLARFLAAAMRRRGVSLAHTSRAGRPSRNRGGRAPRRAG